MTGKRRVWVVEEVEADGQMAQRQTLGEYELQDDGSWAWVRPDERLPQQARVEWDRVMDKLKNVEGEDLRPIVCSAGLLDYCLNPESIDNYNG
jgi:hypothetical protein